MKILIIEDTQANLEVAKSFFSGITEHEFVYAENLVDADCLLPDVDGVITDRSIPFSFDHKLGFEDDSSDEPFLQHNGYLVLLCATLADIPVVMLSSHGNYTFTKWYRNQFSTISNNIEKKRSAASYFTKRIPELKAEDVSEEKLKGYIINARDKFLNSPSKEISETIMALDKFLEYSQISSVKNRKAYAGMTKKVSLYGLVLGRNFNHSLNKIRGFKV